MATSTLDLVHDAYGLWAMATDFRWIDPGSDAIALLARRRVSPSAQQHQPAPLPPLQPCDDVTWAGIYDTQRYVVVEVKRSSLIAQKPWLVEWLSEQFDAIELASAIAPAAIATPRAQPSRSSVTTHHAATLAGHHQQSQNSGGGGTVIGCIDDGFPIAQPMYWQSAPRRQHRVLAYWQQDLVIDDTTSDVWHPLGQGSSADGRLNWRYGAEMRPRLTPPPEPQAGSDFDEISYYRRIGLNRLVGSATHGAHVMDLLAGPCTGAARNFGAEQVPPPDITQAQNADRASTSDLVLVQLPSRAIDDPTGRWLGRNILDGAHYIVATAKAHGAAKVVINVSWGPQTGPHDGSSLLEQALDELIPRSHTGQGSRVAVVLPAGNSHMARAHARWSLQQGGEVTWVVPPLQHDPYFLELWCRASSAELPPLTVTGPNGTTWAITTQHGTQPLIRAGRQVGAVSITRACNGQIMALVAVHPEHLSAQNGRGEHGLWRIATAAQPHAGTRDRVEVYISRSHANWPGSRGSVNAYLWDPRHERYARSLAGHFRGDAPGAVVRRAGTLSGLATGRHTTVVGSLYASNSGQNRPGESQADYSSLGPTSDGRTSLPQSQIATDRSRDNPGLRASGVRWGQVVKLTGTSMAAPQVARQLVNERNPR